MGCRHGNLSGSYRCLSLLAAIIFQAMILPSCSDSKSNDTSQDSVIKNSDEVLDIQIYSQKTAPNLSKNSEILVGFDENDRESRMLLFFPKVNELWDPNVVLNSIANIQILVYCDREPINPENIKMYPITKPWTAAATWLSRFALVKDMSWDKPGGDYDSSIDPVSPSIQQPSGASKFKELAFDITEPVTKMVANGQPNYGFIILAEKSDLNGENRVQLYSRNSDVRPNSVLVFTRKDTLAP